MAMNLNSNYLLGTIPLKFIDSQNGQPWIYLTICWLGIWLFLDNYQNQVSLNVKYNNFSSYILDTNFSREFPTSNLYGNASICTSWTDNSFEQLGVESPKGHSIFFNVKIMIGLLFSSIGMMFFSEMCVLIKAKKMPQQEFEY